MFNAASSNNTNIPAATTSGSFSSSGGVYNSFATPEVDDGRETKRDNIKVFLIAVLALTILLAIISYVYASYLGGQVSGKKASLANLDNNPNIVKFDSNLKAMRDLSQKLKLLNSVNDSRVYISGMFFPIIESVVESSKTSYVYFSKIDLKKSSSNTSMSVSLSGVAQDYLALSRQLTNFKSAPANQYIKDFKFTSLALDPNGRVTFDITFSTDVSTNMYLKFIKNLDTTLTVKSSSPGPLFKNDNKAEIFSTSTVSSAQISTSSVISTTSKINPN